GKGGDDLEGGAAHWGEYSGVGVCSGETEGQVGRTERRARVASHPERSEGAHDRNPGPFASLRVTRGVAPGEPGLRRLPSFRLSVLPPFRPSAFPSLPRQHPAKLRKDP